MDDHDLRDTDGVLLVYNLQGVGGDPTQRTFGLVGENINNTRGGLGIELRGTQETCKYNPSINCADG